MNSPIVAISTCGTMEEAKKIAHGLLESRLAACVNIVPGVRSLYRYKGQLEDERELLLVIKSRRALYPRLEARVRMLHPYQVCEVLLLEVGAGAEPYLAWIASETADVVD